MAAQSNGDTAFEVPDDGEIDRSFKQRIINALNRVDEREDYLYVQAPVEDGMQANHIEQDLYWGMIVKQFLRTIEQLLRSDEIGQSAHYYHEVELGSVELIPRNTEQVPFQDYLDGGMAPVGFRLRHNLAEDADLPKPVEREFRGLKAVIESDGVVSKTWTVRTREGGAITTQDKQPVPKIVYERAVRNGLEFLQEVGVGIDVDPEPYTGDNGPGL
jgi:hypothetical protein